MTGFSRFAVSSSVNFSTGDAGGLRGLLDQQVAHHLIENVASVLIEQLRHAGALGRIHRLPAVVELLQRDLAAADFGDDCVRRLGVGAGSCSLLSRSGLRVGAGQARLRSGCHPGLILIPTDYTCSA